MKCVLCEKDFSSLKGLNSHLTYCEKTIILKDDVIKMYNNGSSIREISSELKLSKSKVSEYLGDDVRDLSDANILSHKKYPDNFKHSEETKNITREKRIKFLKDNPEKTAWRLSNLSYPESLFLNKLKELKWDEKYLIIREKSFFPYFIDFAFENEKMAVEIDGSQHLEEDRKKRDSKKDDLLNNNGWGVVRITDFEIKNNIDKVFEVLSNKLSNQDNQINIKVGILRESKKYVKKERNNHFTESEIQCHIKQRKVIRPPHSILLEEIKELGLEGTGRKYGVSGNTIKKWNKYYYKQKLKNNI